MIKLLRISSLFCVLFITATLSSFSQSELNTENSYKNNSFVCSTSALSFGIHSRIHNHQELDNHSDESHDHSHDLSLRDIISSDKSTDFNCSGGFCMDESHYHKKGLTLRRQFFGYFMIISC